MDRFTVIFDRVLEILEGMEIRYLVVGSVAGVRWGLRRTTVDIDLLIHVAPERSEDLFARVLADGLYLPIDSARRAIADGGSFNVLDPDTTGKIDLFLGDPNDAFTAMRMDARVTAPILGRNVYVDSAENLILSKLSWRASSLSEVQWRDCFEIAAINDLDVDHLREWAAKLGIADDVERLLASIPD